MHPEDTHPDRDDDTPMTPEEARAHFEAMGIEIVGDDKIRIVD